MSRVVAHRASYLWYPNGDLPWLEFASDARLEVAVYELENGPAPNPMLLRMRSTLDGCSFRNPRIFE